jgi:hypothetical protein
MGCIWDKTGQGMWKLVQGSGGNPQERRNFSPLKCDLDHILWEADQRELEKLRLELWRGYWAVADFALKTGANIESVIAFSLRGA